MVQALPGGVKYCARFWCFAVAGCAILGRFLLISNNKISGLRKKTVNEDQFVEIALG